VDDFHPDDPATGDDRPRNARKPPEARKAELLAQAIDYFSQEGFDGGTRELARRIGITQPLIYRYFPSKDDLINEVYSAVYLSQWKDAWTEGLRDRSTPLRDRLMTFYADYTATIFNRTWMRIFFFAGLKGLDINTRYIGRVVSHLLTPICREARASIGADADGPITPAEIELAWTMHGAIFYQGIREHVYGLPDRIDYAAATSAAVDMYLRLAPDVIAKTIAPQGG
jgi:AcrR family transcriptional regulator